MRNFDVIIGRMSEAARFINVPLHWFQQHPARERREVWLSTSEGEVQLVVHSRLLPVRPGHLVEAVVAGDTLVGLTNMTTGQAINYLRADPPLLWDRKDSVVIALLSVGALTSALLGMGATSVLIAALMLVGLPLVQFVRVLLRRRLQASVDRALGSSLRGRDAASAIRRVK